MVKCECGICKTCKNREACKRYRQRHPERLKDSWIRQNDKKKESGYFKDWYRRSEEARKKSAERSKKRAKLFPEKVRAEVKKHNEKNREKYLARQSLRRAVSRGKIMKPKNCEKCGQFKNRIEGHHNDYSKRLEVEWLCVDCHKNEHGKLGGVL